MKYDFKPYFPISCGGVRVLAFVVPAVAAFALSYAHKPLGQAIFLAFVIFFLMFVMTTVGPDSSNENGHWKSHGWILGWLRDYLRLNVVGYRIYYYLGLEGELRRSPSINGDRPKLNAKGVILVVPIGGWFASTASFDRPLFAGWKIRLHGYNEQSGELFVRVTDTCGGSMIYEAAEMVSLLTRYTDILDREHATSSESRATWKDVTHTLSSHPLPASSPDIVLPR